MAGYHGVLPEALHGTSLARVLLSYEEFPMKYQVPKLPKPPKVKKRQVLLVASGDLRLAANQNCWPAQRDWRTPWARPLPRRATN